MKTRAMLVLFCGLSGALACTGAVGGGGAGGSNAGGSSNAGNGASSAGSAGGGAGGGSSSSSGSASPACAAAGVQASPTHLRLLSPTQYDNTIQDLLKVGGRPAETYNVAGGETAALDKTSLEFRANAAAAIASQAAATLATWSPCVPANAAAQSACEDQIIAAIGMKAYRRPLSAADTAQMKTLFDAGIAAKDFATGVDWFLTGLLQSPPFQYQVVRPSATEQSGQVVPIRGYEMASRLSYAIWDSMPDDALFAAATNGLDDAGGVQTQVDRMVASRPLLVRGMTAFYSDWLNIAGYSEGLVKQTASGAPDPAFTQDVAVALGQSLLMGATQLYASGTPNVSALFTGSSYYMNGLLQQYYKTGGGGGATFVPTDMPGQHRSGLLTHPGFLAVNARPQVTAPINRGFFVTSNLLCLGLQVPTNIVIPDLPDTQPGLTTRQLIEQTHVVAACASCHAIIDPPGFALEWFDQVGNVRTTDNGKPVDTSGTIVNGGDLNGPFADGDAFVARVATSRTVRTCFAQQFLEHAIAGNVASAVAPADQCSVTALGQKFAPSGDLLALVSLVATSDSFLLRTSEGPAQ